MLAELKSFLKEQKIDFLFLPNSDQFFLEYLPESEKRIQYLTGFSGSNATIILGQKKSYFFTDGRYILQAQNQLDLQEFEIFNIGEKSVLKWLEENLQKSQKLALDPKLVSVNFIKHLEKIGAKIVFLNQNPIDEIWQNRPFEKNSAIYFCHKNSVGFDSKTKRNQLLSAFKAEALVITKPENICWLLNARASDIEFSPLFLAYAILFKNGEIDLFVDSKRILDLQNINLEKVNFIDPKNIDLHFSNLRKKIKEIQIDLSSTNCWLYSILQKNDFSINYQVDPIEINKACKNSAEISGAIKAHQIDGLALTKFLFWLENSLKKGEEIDEIKAAEKLLKMRKKNPAFLYPSFATICGFGANGAVIHYHADSKTNKKISGDSLLLIDSGGQYFDQDFCATTDVTRTIAIGNISLKMIESFTRVLKGHIALARAKFPRGTSGAELDVLAREHLWNIGINYDHGTGHGVGSFLSVHEGPCGISKRATQELLEGMILSNEPGFYLPNQYGIRIENLMVVKKFNEDFLQFKTLTLAPIDAALVDFKMLTYPEKKWLKEYHQNLLTVFADDLESDEKIWLENLSKKFII
ncbi:MAG: aminopeptidase P family protein [Rickettsiales bacterium]|nr:aminopeptidase P family protein [Rickettsiales bacterium]